MLNHKKNKSSFDPFAYYEASVQGPQEHVVIFDQMYRNFRKKTARVFHEDFSGTFRISCEWVKSKKNRKAIAIDLDPAPLAYGREHGYLELASNERKRLDLILGDVTTVRAEKADVIAACNFSFFIFQERKLLKRYFLNAKRRLATNGIFVLEMAGGPGFIQKGRESKKCRAKGLGSFTYTWEQKSFDPIQRRGHYAIHFTPANKKRIRDVFTYDWRIWTLPEVRDLMLECGFSDVVIYWEASDKNGNGTGEYLPAEDGDNAYAWIAFVVGLK